MIDISEKLLKDLQESFRKKYNLNSKIKILNDKVASGNATYKEANEMSIILGDILAEVYEENITSAKLPNKKMYYNIADKIIRPTMKNNYTLISAYSKEVQNTINQKLNINLNAIKPKLNEGRIDGIINRLSNADEYDDVKWVLNEPIKNFSQSIVDECIRANADFHFKSGISPKIIRISTGKCCKWCDKLAGVYDYEDVKDTGNNVFRRHEYCRCTVEYLDGKKSQNVHNKEWKYYENDSQIEQLKKEAKKENIVISGREREEFANIKNTLSDSQYVVKNIEEYVKMPYNKREQLKREYKTISSINKSNWNKEFIEKCKKTYYEYREKNIELSKHFLQNFFKRNRFFDIEEIIHYMNKEINFVEIKDGKNIRYYDTEKNIKSHFIRLVSNKGDTEFISIVFDNIDKSKIRIGEQKWKQKKILKDI